MPCFHSICVWSSLSEDANNNEISKGDVSSMKQFIKIIGLVQILRKKSGEKYGKTTDRQTDKRTDRQKHRQKQRQTNI